MKKEQRITDYIKRYLFPILAIEEEYQYKNFKLEKIKVKGVSIWKELSFWEKCLNLFYFVFIITLIILIVHYGVK